MTDEVIYSDNTEARKQFLARVATSSIKYSKFIVLGLPRSRTYWLSVFLGCMHEALYHYPDYADFMKSAELGDSTTCIMQVAYYIKPIKRKLIIHRDLTDVMMSMYNIGIEPNFEQLDMAANELKQTKGLHINFEDINNRLNQIWYHLRGEPYDRARGDQLIQRNMQNEKLIELVKTKQQEKSYE